MNDRKSMDPYVAIKEQIVGGLDEIRNQGLFLHHEIIPGLCFHLDRYQDRPVYRIETLAAINVLVANGTMLFYGGHGGGKTTLAKLLGQLFFAKSDQEIESCILRGHSQLTEEKILGTLDIDQLMHPERRQSEQIAVIWSRFVQSDWKIIDEINRMSPYAQNIILSLLAEGIAKYYDQAYSCPDFTLFATMNPRDEGAFDLPLPFLDRFALAVPVTMPDYENQQAIGLRDKQIQPASLAVRQILEKDIRSIRREIDQMELDDDAGTLIDMIMEDSRLCDRIKKEINQDLHVNNGLCRGCRFHIVGQTCNKIQTPFSVRVRQDLIRYGKALAWYLNESHVGASHIQAIAPYMIWHRTRFSKDFLADRGIYKPAPEIQLPEVLQQPLKAGRLIVHEISARMEKRKPFITIYRQMLKKDTAKRKESLQKLADFQDDDLFVRYLHQKAQNLPDTIPDPQTELEQAQDIEAVDRLIQKFQTAYTMPDQVKWITRAREKRRSLFMLTAKTETLDITVDEFQQILLSDGMDRLRNQVRLQLGDDLAEMKAARIYRFDSPDQKDRIDLTLYWVRTGNYLECSISGSLTSDFYNRIKTVLQRNR